MVPEEKGMPILVLKDRHHKWISSTVVPNKGVCPFAVQSLGHDIGDILGYRSVVVKSDQEESIISLREAMAAHKGVEVQVEESPVGDSASNGYVESAIRQVQKQIRNFDTRQTFFKKFSQFMF